MKLSLKDWRKVSYYYEQENGNEHTIFGSEFHRSKIFTITLKFVQKKSN